MVQLQSLTTQSGTIYVEVNDVSESNSEGGLIEAAGAVNAQQGLDSAVGAVKDILAAVAEELSVLGNKVAPQELEAEFTVTFDAGTKASLVPILVTTNLDFSVRG